MGNKLFAQIYGRPYWMMEAVILGMIVFKERFENVGVYSLKYSLGRRQTKIKTV